MQPQKKPLKYYLTIFLLTSGIVLAYSIYLFVSADAEVKDLAILWIMPFFFTLIYYGGDSLAVKINERRAKKDYEGIFLGKVAAKMNESKAFLAEDMRLLQNSEKFQKQLFIAYTIYQFGETEVHTVKNLKAKFPQDSVEGKALDYAIQVIEEKTIEETSK